ncbi:hypothetical protein KRMM14A1259_21440 [Krasilnikovia sp. MM14-A1259]
MTIDHAPAEHPATVVDAADGPMVTSRPPSVNKPFYYGAARVHAVKSSVLATSGVDWSQVHAVRLLGVALAALILFWAIRRMFGGK